MHKFEDARIIKKYSFSSPRAKEAYVATIEEVKLFIDNQTKGDK